MLLARTVAHTVDVDGMLERLEPQQFDEWAAMYRIQSWGVEWTAGAEEKPRSSLDTFKSMAGM